MDTVNCSPYPGYEATRTAGKNARKSTRRCASLTCRDCGDCLNCRDLKKYLTFQNCEIYFNSSVERILYHHITINTSHCDACDNGMKFFILSPQSPQSLQFKQSPQSLQVRLAHLRVDFRAFFVSKLFPGNFYASRQEKITLPN